MTGMDLHFNLHDYTTAVGMMICCIVPGRTTGAGGKRWKPTGNPSWLHFASDLVARTLGHWWISFKFFSGSGSYSIHGLFSRVSDGHCCACRFFNRMARPVSGQRGMSFRVCCKYYRTPLKDLLSVHIFFLPDDHAMDTC